MLLLAGNPMPEMGGGGGPSERFMDYTLRIFLTVFLCDDIFPLG